MRIAVLISNGSEEIEAITPIDVLRRSGAEVDVISVGGEFVTGSHGIIIKADKCIEDADISAYDAVVVPGGMPGATNIAKSKKAIELIKRIKREGKLVSAICASPAVVLAENGLIGEEKATCYPLEGFIKALKGNYTGANVQVDGNLITANGPRSALEFSDEICKYLKLNAKF